MSFNSVFRTTRQVVACSRRVKAPPRSPTARLAVGSAQRPKPERVDHRRKIDVASSISASDINADDEPPEEAPSAATGRTTTAWWQAGLVRRGG